MIQLVVEFTDVRIFAFGTMAKPRSDLTVNLNAHLFLHPPGIEGDGNGNIFTKLASMRRNRLIIDHGAYPMSPSTSVPAYRESSPSSFNITIHIDSKYAMNMSPHQRLTVV